MRRLAVIAGVLVALARSAGAQQSTSVIYCNNSVVVDAASSTKGTTLLLTSPMVGGISVCSTTMVASGTVSAGLYYATSSSGSFTPISPGWAFSTGSRPFANWNPNGVAWVPAGNGLFLSASTAAPLQAQIQYFESNPGH